MKKILKYLLLLTVILLTVVFSFSTTSAFSMSRSIGPNSFFHFLDIAVEKVDLLFTFNPTKKAEKNLQYVQERLEELQELNNDAEEKIYIKAKSNYKSQLAVVEKSLMNLTIEDKEIFKEYVNKDKTQKININTSLKSSVPKLLTQPVAQKKEKSLMQNREKILEEKQSGKITLNIPLDPPFSKTVSVKLSGVSGPKKANGDIPFSGIMTPEQFRDINLGIKIPISTDSDLKVAGILNQKNISRNKIKLEGNFGIGLDKIDIGGLSSVKAINTQEASLSIDKSGVMLLGRLKADINQNSLAGIEVGAGANVEIFVGRNDNWHTKISAGFGNKLTVFGISIKGKDVGGDIKLHSKGIDVNGYLPVSLAEGSFKGLINKFGADLSGLMEIEVPLSSAEGFVNTVTDGAICGWENKEDAARCGYESVKNAAICGTETVTSKAKCGSKTVTNTAKCGSKYVTSSAQCGYKYVTDGAKCGWNTITSFFGGKEAKRCKVSKKCKVPKSCTIAATCEIAKSCEKSRKPKSCSLAKTCDKQSDAGKYVGEVKGKVSLRLKGSVRELKTKANFTGKLVGEYCFSGKCYGVNQNVASFQLGPPTKACFANIIPQISGLPKFGDKNICLKL